MKKLTKTEIRRTGRFWPQILLAAPWPQMHAFPYEWTSKSAFGCSFLSDLLYHFRAGSHGQGGGGVRGEAAQRACALESLILTQPKCLILQLLGGHVEIRCTCSGFSIFIYRCTHMCIHISWQIPLFMYVYISSYWNKKYRTLSPACNKAK